MATGFYAQDGSMRVTVVAGTSWTGVFAADGSINVKLRTSEYGTYHPCGAILVSVSTSPSDGWFAPWGAWYVRETPYTNGGSKVTVVSGSLSGGGGPTQGTPMGLLLLLTYPT